MLHLPTYGVVTFYFTQKTHLFNVFDSYFWWVKTCCQLTF